MSARTPNEISAGLSTAVDKLRPKMIAKRIEGSVRTTRKFESKNQVEAAEADSPFEVDCLEQESMTNWSEVERCEGAFLSG